MAINLAKGGDVNLIKEDPTLTMLTVGLGWDTRSGEGADFDIDGCAILLTKEGKVRGDNDLVFYNNLTSADGAVTHSGDNRTGEGEGDDESITIDLPRVPTEIERIAICISIHNATTHQQSFGQVHNATVRCINAASGAEIVRYNLSGDAAAETALVFGEVCRDGREWKFKAVGQGQHGGLPGLCAAYGLLPENAAA